MRFLFLMLSLTFCLTSWLPAALAGKPVVDLNALSSGDQQLFLLAQNMLTDWHNDDSILVEAGIRIDGLIKEHPDFLPAYFEKARYIIITGTIGGNNFKKANQEALKILLDLQRKAPSYEKPYRLAGHAYTNVGDLTKAAQQFAMAESLDTTDAWLYINRATLLERQGRLDEALRDAQTGLVQAGDNAKALVVAIDEISRFEQRLGRGDPVESIVDMVFRNFPKTEDRLRIAERLLDFYSGRREILRYTAAILRRQESETKDLPRIKLLKASVVLSDGYINTQRYLARYSQESLYMAEELLRGILDDPSVKDRATLMMITIELNRNNFVKSRKMLDGLEAQDPSNPKFRYTRALVEYLSGNEKEAVRILEDLHSKDPNHRMNELLMAAYEARGDFAKVDAYRKNLAETSPRDPWTLGSYSTYLLGRGKVDEAIKYGEASLSIMDYPVGRAGTSLAYLVRAAARDRAGNSAGARNDFKRATALGISPDYIRLGCGKYCDDVVAIIKKLQPLPPGNERA